MSGLILPNRFTSQPQYPAQIDWSNPITVGLSFVHNTILRGYETKGSVTRPYVGPVVWTYEGFSSNGATAGTYIQSRNTAQLGGLNNSTVFTLSRTAAALGASRQNIGTGGNALYSERGSSGNDIYKVCWADTSGVLTAEFTYRNDAGTLLQQRISASGLNNNSLIASAIVKAGTTHSVYIDGRISSGTFGSASNAFTDATVESWVGDDKGDPDSPWNGTIPLVVGWTRSLSKLELDSLRANPWQIFKAPQRRIWVAGASSGSTGTVAYTNANDTSSASGATTVTGSVAKSNANDTSAASGTTTITGALARTNVNDTSAASGTPTVIGTLATTNANDTSNASGSVGNSITGTVATTNANDTSAASGTTTVTGTLARTNANDTSSASGTTTVTGTVASTNANDTAAASGIAGSITGTVATTNKNDTVLASGTAGSLRTNQGGGWETYVAPIRKKTVKEVKKEFELLSYAEVVAEQKTAEIKIQHTRAKIQEIKSNVSAVKPFSLAPEIAKLKLLIAEEKIKIEALRELETKILIHAKIKKEKEKLLTDLAFIAEYLMDEDEYDYD